ncbi:hypothetical protein C8Q75DRAFT_808607 [Abortiporus biennis]|nr:hypothetical protein C8Q75DRAFT_808607 [Abortiporus biennis]
MDSQQRTGNVSDDDEMPPLAPLHNSDSPPSESSSRPAARIIMADIPRSARPDDDGMESDSTMPSLQTVSDSSEEEYATEEDEEDDSFDEDDLPRLASASDEETRRHREIRETNAASSNDEAEHEREPLMGGAPPFLFGHPTTTDIREGLLREAINMALMEQAIVDGEVPTQHDGPENATSMNFFRDFFGTMQEPRVLLDELLNLRNRNEPEDDPKRAEIIISKLETVPEELLPRYQLLRGGNEDGCAICRESFLSDDWVPPPSSPSSSTNPKEHKDKDTALSYFAALPYDRRNIPSILAFPCPGMHLYHDTCIFPWLSRKSTCPACRFDVDPHSLTHRHRRTNSGARRQGRRAVWAPPKAKGFRKWLEDEENRRDGKPVIEEPLPASDPDEIPHLADVDEADDEDWYTDSDEDDIDFDDEDEEEEDGDEDDGPIRQTPYRPPQFISPTRFTGPPQPLSALPRPIPTLRPYVSVLTNDPLFQPDDDNDNEPPPPLIAEREEETIFLRSNPLAPPRNRIRSRYPPPPRRSQPQPQQSPPLAHAFPIEEESEDDGPPPLAPAPEEDDSRSPYQPPEQNPDVEFERSLTAVRNLFRALGTLPLWVPEHDHDHHPGHGDGNGHASR